MKTTTFLLLLIFCIAETQAQNYMLTFTGTGASTTVDSVHVQNLTQCTDTSLLGNATLNLSSTVGLDNFAEVNSSINVFPNPGTGSFIVSFIAPANGNTSIEIYDAIGKRVAKNQQFLIQGKHSFNIKGIVNGVFLLKIQSDKYSCTSKLLSNSGNEGTISISETPYTNISANAKIKGNKNIIAMQYNTGDRIKFTGYSGIYKTIFMLTPTQDQTVTFNFIPCTDADGNNYGVVKIDTVVWMEENLKATKFQNGDSIPNITNTAILDTLMSPAYSHYNNDGSLVPIYGELYNWFAAADPRNICPSGWRVPEDTIWLAMETFLGNQFIAGGKIKENCSNLWMSPNTGATNETGFTGLPGGQHQAYYPYTDIGIAGGFWSSTEDSIIIDDAHIYAINNIYAWIANSTPGKTDSQSIRCIKN